MFKNNNPQIDYALLEKRVAEDRIRLRHQQRVSAPPQVESLLARLKEPQESGWKARLKRMPLVGPQLRRAYHAYKIVKNPHVPTKQKIKALPFIGSGAQWLFALLKIHQTRAYQQQVIEQLNHQVVMLERQVQQQSKKFQTELENLREQLEAKLAQLHRQFDGQKALLAQGMQRVQTAEPVANKMALTTRSPLLDALVDRFYVAFEDTFRGETDDIQQRQAVYLPFLREAAIGSDEPILDIGCGRGEWLDLLRRSGYKGYGYDINKTMTERCQAAGLEVHWGDALEHLAQVPEGSLAAITAFQVIEHIEFGQLLLLFELAHRALRSGGLLIFETPNPENLQVGGHTFYNDPSHGNPIPPAVSAFIAKQAHFTRTHIERLHPYPANELDAEPSQAARELRRLCFGPQDYALIAWKA